MTGPVGPASGELRIVAHVDTSKVPGELERGLDKAGTEAESTLRKETGPGMGNALGDGIENTLEAKGRDFATAIEHGLRRERVPFGNFDVDEDRVRHQFRSLFGELADELRDAFSSAAESAAGGGGGGGGGGIFGTLSDSIRDAIGAGFNVSGRSPLVGFLIPVFGAVAAAIGAAIEAANGLAAVLTTIPAALAAIGIQAGILITAFHGVGEAISGALAAKNVEEFKKAIEGLAPAAQAFVTSLVPRLRQFMEDFRRGIQEAFFQGLGDRVIPNLLAMIEDKFLAGTVRIATALGDFAETLAAALQTPAFVNFINLLLPAIETWIRELQPAFFVFIQSLSNFAAATLPFFSKLGTGVANIITKFSKVLDDLANNVPFQKWLEDMLPVLAATGELLKGAFEFIVSVVSALNSGGGLSLILFLANVLKSLAVFFSTPLGGAAFSGLIDILKLLTLAFEGMIVAIALVGAAVTGLREAFSFLFEVVGDIVGGIVGLFTGDVPEAMGEGIGKIIDKVLGLPGRLIRALGNLAGIWFDAGVKLVKGLGDGIEAAWTELTTIISRHIHSLSDWLPGSPAKKGPLSGAGWTYRRGQSMVRDFASGIGSESGALSAVGNSIASSIVFGPGSIRVAYEGVSPTPDEARMTGSAIGEGVLGQLSARNDALAVRTL